MALNDLKWLLFSISLFFLCQMASKGLLIWEIWPKMTENWPNMQKSSFLTFWPKLSNHSQLILIGNDFKRLIFFFIMSSSNFQSSAISATSTISAILAILYLRVSNIPFGLFFLIFCTMVGGHREKKWHSPIFRQNPHFSIFGQKGPKIAKKWGFGHFALLQKN